MSGELTHLDGKGQAHMVAVTPKAETERGAIATSQVRLNRAAFEAVRDSSGPKGDALQVARIAGISAAKRTSDLIPLCHPVRITSVQLQADLDDAANTVTFTARVDAVDRTGVEMEALTCCTVAALALYDMCKAVDRSAVVQDIRLLRKWGGKSGDFAAA